MAKQRVEFDAHRKVKKVTEVEFQTRSGQRIEFPARKKVKVPVHVKFTADTRKN